MFKCLMLYYLFFLFFVNEIGVRGFLWCEVGYGVFVEKLFLGVFLDEDVFLFAVRVNIEIFESNGLFFMVVVCLGFMVFMDVGVLFIEYVGVILIGFVMDEDEEMGEVKRYAFMDDIMGFEDVLGDMDFKIVGICLGVIGI